MSPLNHLIRDSTLHLGSQRKWGLEGGSQAALTTAFPRLLTPHSPDHPLFSVNSCFLLAPQLLPISFSSSFSLHPPWVYSSCPIYRLVTPKPLPESTPSRPTASQTSLLSSWMPLGQLKCNLLLTDNHLTQETSGPFSPSSCSFLSRPITPPLCACHVLPSSKPQSK